LHKRKKWIVSLSIVFCFLIGLNYLVNRYVDEVVGNLIREFVREKSDGFYTVEFDDIAYILNNGRFLVTDFEFSIRQDQPKSQVADTLDHSYTYTATIPKLHIDIIDFWSVFIRKKLRVIGIEIYSPIINITNLNKYKHPKKISFEAGNLYKVLSLHLEELQINNFAITEGALNYHTLGGADYDNFQVNGLNFKVQNFLVNKSSAQRDDKFFYTDDIFLETGNQELLLKDSIHKVSFDKFYISTRTNELGFENLNVTQRKDPEADKLSHDRYEISLPDLRFAGVDFVSAYNDNLLLIDSIHIGQPVIDLIKRAKKTAKKPERDNLLDLFMMYHDYLEINHLHLAEARLILTDETGPHPKKYNVDHIGATVSNIKIDTSHSSIHAYGFDFSKIDLVVKDYEVTLPDSANTIKFAEFTMSSEPYTITLKDLSVQPDGRRTTANSIFAHIPYLVVTGFDVAKAINRDTLQIKEFYVENPEIKISPARSREVNSTALDTAGLFGLYTKINSVFALFEIDRFNINNGKLNFSNPDAASAIDLHNLNLSLKNIKVDSILCREKSLIGKSRYDISFKNSSFSSENGEAKLESLNFAFMGGHLKIDNLNYKKSGETAGAETTFYLGSISVTGIDPDEILFSSKISLDTLAFQNADISLNALSFSKSKMEGFSTEHPPLPPITVKHFVVDHCAIDYNSENGPVFSTDNVNINISDLSLDQSLGDKPMNMFDFRRINKISVQDYNLFLTGQEHLLEIKELDMVDNSTVSISNISLIPSGKPNNQYRIHAPKILVTGVDLKKILKDSYYDGDEIIIDQPTLFLKLAQGRQEKLTNMDLGFIPLLLRDKFLGAQANCFQVHDASILVRQKTANDSLIVECDKLDLTVEQFRVDSTTEMVPDQFLFANDVKLMGEYLSFYQPGSGHFYSINHCDLSTKERDIRLDGIYVNTSIGNLSDEDGKMKLTIDFLNMVDLDFFNLTQNKKLDLSQISIDNCKMVLVPPAKKVDSEQSGTSGSGIREFRIYEQNYPFDTMLLKSINIGQLFVTNSELIVDDPVEQRTNLVLPDIWLLAEGIKYNPVTALDSTRIFYSDNIVTKLTNLSYVLPDNLAAIKVHELSLNSQDSTVKIRNFILDPLISKYDYAYAKGYQSTWMRLENDSIVINKVDFLGIINNKTFRAGKMDIARVDFEIYRDKRIPFPEWQRRPLPQTELKDLGFTIQIDTINLNDSYIGYQEHAEKSNTPGEVFFTDLNARVVNVTNDSLHTLKFPRTNISAAAKVYGKGEVNAQFQFDLLNPENIHTYGVEVDSFDITEFNRILIPNASAQVKSGKTERIVMTARANNEYSYGEMRFYYHDLKVQLLNRESETPKGLGNILGSFFANTFIIRTNNPKNFVLRKGDIFFERDEKRAIFNYWTKSFLSGVVSSIGVANNKKKIKRMQEENLKKIQQKKSEELTLHK
jgi:hypothetical protein